MPDFTHADVEYEIASFHARVGDLVDHNGQPVIVYFSRVRVKPPADTVEDHKGWVLVREGNQTAIARTDNGALLQAQEYIQQNPA